VLLSRSITAAIEAVAAVKGADAAHFRARLRHLPETVERVRDLGNVDWAVLARAWRRSPAGWNHVQRATSRLLSLTLGKFHPFTRQVRERFVWKAEPPRVPDLTPEAFERVLGYVPAELRPCYRTLVLTGMRRGEYLRCTLEHLMPELPGIRVPGTKTAGSAAVIPVARSVWPWIEAAIPCPVSDWMLRTRWYEGCDAAKVARVRLHDLRHCTGQWLVNAGRPEAGVQRFLRHASPATTRRYTLQRTRSEDAAALASVMVPGFVPGRSKGRRKAGA
jgi:integrase